MYLETFNDVIDDYLIEHSLTVNRFSKIVGISCSTILRWKNYKFYPSIDDVKKIAVAINVSVDYLLGFDDNIDFCHVIDENESLITKLSELMKLSGTSAYKLAKECNFQKAAVSKWLKGIRVPRINNIIELALYFDLLPSYFID